MHRSNAPARQIVVHHEEDAFLHFAAVPGIENDLHAFGQVEDHGSFLIEAQFPVFSTWAFEALSTTKSGLKFLSSAVAGRINILVTKWACQATSITKRTFRRDAGLAPQKQSTTKSFLLESSLTASAFWAFHDLWDKGLLLFLKASEVHQKVSLVTSFMTMNLSFVKVR